LRPRRGFRLAAAMTTRIMLPSGGSTSPTFLQELMSSLIPLIPTAPCSKQTTTTTPRLSRSHCSGPEERTTHPQRSRRHQWLNCSTAARVMRNARRTNPSTGIAPAAPASTNNRDSTLTDEEYVRELIGDWNRLDLRGVV
jgi:hypothetical protein